MCAGMKLIIGSLAILDVNKKTPEGAYAGCVGLRKNYGYVGWKWKLSSVCNKCVQERRRCSVKD